MQPLLFTLPHLTSLYKEEESPPRRGERKSKGKGHKKIKKSEKGTPLIERTFSMVKPDAVSKNQIGEIIRRLEAASLKVIALNMTQLKEEKAQQFYHVHRERPFFKNLISFICSGKVVPMVLEGEDAVLSTRALIGATNPKEAKKGTIRSDFGTSIEANAIHASDSKETASFEISVFFPDLS